MANVLSWIERDKISVGKLRGVGKLHHLEDEAEITKGVDRFGKYGHCDKERKREIVQNTRIERQN